jgi:hypothetical protein
VRLRLRETTSAWNAYESMLENLLVSGYLEDRGGGRVTLRRGPYYGIWSGLLWRREILFRFQRCRKILTPEKLDNGEMKSFDTFLNKMAQTSVNRE